VKLQMPVRSWKGVPRRNSEDGLGKGDEQRICGGVKWDWLQHAITIWEEEGVRHEGGITEIGVNGKPKREKAEERARGISEQERWRRFRGKWVGQGGKKRFEQVWGLRGDWGGKVGVLV